jgi:hypothetical protein
MRLGQGFDPGGETLGVGHDLPGRIPLDLPAVIDHHVLIAGVLHSARHQGVGRSQNELLADVAGELVPAVPTHGRREREAVRCQGERCHHEKERHDKADAKE